jgi:hypothetical protein
MIEIDSAPRGRNARTLSGPEGSSNRDAYNRRGIRVIKVFVYYVSVAVFPTYRQTVPIPTCNSTYLSGYLGE